MSLMTVVNLGLQGQRFVVTGAAGCIGFAISKMLQQSGASVYGIDLSAPPPSATSTLEPSEVFDIFHTGDVTDEATVKNFAEVSQRESIDGVILCAGIAGEIVDAENIDPDNFADVIAASVTHSMLFIKHYTAYFKAKQTGQFLLFSSTAGIKGNALMPSYTAAKHAIIGLVRSYSRELGPFGVRVNCVLPGVIESAMARDIQYRLRSRRESVRRENSLDPNLVNTIPLRRFGSPEDVAYAALFLCSPLANWANGTLLNIDGGALST
jgi:NAD(P)-dependent dehydrogenase (short-subunit alcohol dehydrogenase family)